MDAVLNPRLIASGVFGHWNERLPAEIVTVYPDSRKDVGMLTEWIELWVQSWVRKPHRLQATPLFDVVVMAHCFTRSGDDTARIHVLSEKAAMALSNQVVSVVNVDQSDEPVCGFARLREPTVTMLTRRDAAVERPLLQHSVISWSGLAQPISEE